MSDAKISLDLGARYPFDAPDKWWEDDANTPPAPKSWAHAAARGVIKDMMGRRGIKNGFSGIDEDVRAEMVETVAAIILLAKDQTPT